jgi:Holliday junction resolvase RusA-like endonuclease
MREFVLRIAGQTATKERPRFNPFTGTVRQSRANIINEADVRQIWRDAGEPQMPDDVALGIEMLIFVERPKGHLKKDGSLSKEGERNPIPRNKKPDLDNAIKLVLDALNSRAWRDDVRFAEAHIHRKWGEWPMTVIRVYTLHDGPEEPSGSGSQALHGEAS